MPQITGECSSVMEAVCSIVCITIVIESDKSKPLPLVTVAYIIFHKLRFNPVRVRYGTYRSMAYMLHSPVRNLTYMQSAILAVGHQRHLVIAVILRVSV